MSSETAGVCRIELFGSFRLIHRERITTHFRLQKAALLLAYLALNPQRPHPRERLVDLFWPDLEPQAGRDNLSTTLSSLRRELGAAGAAGHAVLDTDRQTIGLRPQRFVTDVAEFEGLLKQAGGVAVVAERARLLEQAIALYRGDLLAGCYEEWALTAQTAYQHRYREALLDWAEDLETQQEWQQARWAAERAVQADPMCEEATLVLMRVLARQGRAAGAIETFRRLQQRLREELDAEPTQELHQLMARLQRDPDALYTPRPVIEPVIADHAVVVIADHAVVGGTDTTQSMPSPPPSAVASGEPHAGQDEPTVEIAPLHNLPLLLSSFIGREQEMEEIKRFMAQTRLLTLTGIGGCGKTRLALQLGNEVLRQYADGVWLVELAALSDPALVVTTVARTLDIKEQSGQPLTRTLIDRLKSRRLLLILDNCEHLVNASAELMGLLLRACPHLKVLATSREPLSIAGEQTYRVPSLSLPDTQQAVVPDMLRHYSAIQLFIERAQRVKPGFTVTRQNTPVLVQVCRRLDGIPLAIELAATRVRFLTVEDLNRRLDDRFGLLTGGDRMALPRQQTLRALIDWSYDLLTATERWLLRQLSVFRDGWTLEAAEAIGKEEGDETQNPEPGSQNHKVLNLLISLADKSLVIAEERNDSTRYRMLETVRQYAVERLQSSGETGLAGGRHRNYFLALAEAAEPHLTGLEQRHWLERLEADHDNLRAALAWCIEAEAEDGNPPPEMAGLRLCGALQQFWWTRGYFAEGREWCVRALERAKGRKQTGEYANVHNVAGLMAYSQGEYALALAHHEESLTLQGEIGDRPGIAASLNYLGNVVTDQGDPVAARNYYEETLALRKELGDRRGIAIALGNLGNVARGQGEYAAARTYYQESLTIRREIADWSGIANMLNRLGDTAYGQGDYALARTLYEESLETSRQLGYRPGVAYTLMSLGYAARRQGDYALAQTLGEESLRLFRELGDRRGIASTLDNLGNVAYDQGDHAEGRTLCEESLAICREIGYRSGVMNTLMSLGNAAYEQGDYATARRVFEERLSLVSESGSRRGIASALEKLAGTFAAHAEGLRAARLWGAAAALRQSIDAPLPPAEEANYDRQVALIRVALGEDAFRAAREEGRAMTREQAVAYALTGHPGSTDAPTTPE